MMTGAARRNASRGSECPDDLNTATIWIWRSAHPDPYAQVATMRPERHASRGTTFTLSFFFRLPKVCAEKRDRFRRPDTDAMLAIPQVSLIHAPVEGERSWSTRNSKYQPGGAMVPSGGAVAVTAVALVPVMRQPTKR